MHVIRPKLAGGRHQQLTTLEEGRQRAITVEKITKMGVKNENITKMGVPGGMLQKWE
jgi:hypothetical protein